MFSIYADFRAIVEVLVDNKFKQPHVNVYEHERCDPDEPEYHLLPDKTERPPNNPQPALADEEADLATALGTREDERLLRVWGDVGVGKTTFLKHICDVHLNDAVFSNAIGIYTDWRGFAADRGFELSGIQRHFEAAVNSKLGECLTREESVVLDNRVFEESDLFSLERSLRDRKKTEHAQELYRDAQIEKIATDRRFDFTIDRVNVACSENQNRFMIVIDNIDHLSREVLDKLWEFIIGLQVRLVPLVVVAVRDHTEYTSGLNEASSAFHPQRVVPGWKMRLHPPHIQKVIERRLDHLLADDFDLTRYVDGRFVRTDADAKRVCRALLQSPFQDGKTAQFLVRWNNYSVRDQLLSLQTVLRFPGLEGHASHLKFHKAPFRISVDAVLTAFSLDLRLEWTPKSMVFNPYSLETEQALNDKVVAVRILEALVHSRGMVRADILRESFKKWGYSVHSFDVQLRAMLDKDILWATTGAPGDFKYELSELRPSYRGKAYLDQLLHRVVFNFMMSLGVYADTTTGHLASRLPQPVLQDFRNLSAPLDLERVLGRVLALAEMLHRAEKFEVRLLRERHSLDAFVSEVWPISCADRMLAGCQRFLAKYLAANAKYDEREVIQPPAALVEQIAVEHAAVRESVKAWGYRPVAPGQASS